ncbi:MAG TPA: SHOCT domain-containing protein, partial [Saprospiraceae bacterium]|nr:SHOCT domain-containing protein [Saprospiraceae bacterium]
LVKMIPGVGTVIGELSMPVLSGASTYALGRVLANHFQQGGTLADLDLKSARREFEDEIETGKQVATELKNDAPAPEPDATDETLSKLKKMAELRDAGVLTEEEFRELKARLLAQI